MGSNSGRDKEKPMHGVKVGTFRMSKTEVTVAQYRACVKAGRCTKPNTGKYCNWGKARRGAHPVNCVDSRQSRAFCRWAGGRLPSEAEWEYAARSGGKDWKYPWGDEAATCYRTVMDRRGIGCGKKRTWPVCSKTAGNTSQGLCDMAGNVQEWTEDCWHDNYSGAPSDGSAWTKNCSSTFRVIRGGSLLFNRQLEVVVRDSWAPGGPDTYYLGVRCAR